MTYYGGYMNELPTSENDEIETWVKLSDVLPRVFQGMINAMESE